MLTKTLTSIMLSAVSLPALAHVSETHHTHAMEFIALFALLMLAPRIWRTVRKRVMVRVRKD